MTGDKERAGVGARAPQQMIMVVQVAKDFGPIKAIVEMHVSVKAEAPYEFGFKVSIAKPCQGGQIRQRMTGKSALLPKRGVGSRYESH